ncbi:Molybdopterin synthase catalytic subunit MoaE [hydrothermal vent metagenome]|uniref:Molybdopterin synthase catalytic subunit MoaE n=1 Tax=hydrothermal vent metagenome TaxID=652676 RepID=A0A3B0VAU7_9ZZZZ
MNTVLVTDQPLDTQAIISSVEAPEGGAVNVFMGTVRNATKGKKVLKLEFEAYEPMATKELIKIVEKAKTNWPLIKAVVHHRTGEMQIGEVPVVIAVSTAHRGAGFEACQFIIDTLKETVPIWKKEFFEDGEVWVAAHP